MIPRGFDYYLPDSWREAVDIFASVQREGKTPLYYGGGTEILSMARVGSVSPDAVIDIKRIPECLSMDGDGARLRFGAALTLNEIRDSRLFPLLSLAAGRIADHTIQCKLTLGGNLAGTILYHETLLPLLLADATLETACAQGIRQTPVAQALGMDRKLPSGELILGVILDSRYAACPYAHIKKPKIEKIGYPLVSVAAINVDGMLRLAASALCAFPFRFRDFPLAGADAADFSRQLRGELPAPVLDNLDGSPAYRQFIFEQTAEKIVREFQGRQG